MKFLQTILLVTAFFVSSSYSQSSDNKELKKDNKPVVYMTRSITPEGLMAVYNALNHKLPGKVAVKISTGEPGGNHYLKPELIKDLVKSVNGTVVECNVGYPGRRATTDEHMKVAEEHGFTAIANVDIMDAEGEISLPYEKGVNIKEDFVGSHFKNYDSYIILSHFKGHAMGGFGGAIKNMSIGIASPSGKMWIHTAGVSKEQNWDLVMKTPQDKFLESMAEASGAIINSLGDKILYINVMNNLSVDCDCDGTPQAPTMKDIGILASLDPISLDQACVDWIYKVHDGHDLIKRMEERNAVHALVHGEKLGIGSRAYELVNIEIQ